MKLLFGPEALLADVIVYATAQDQRAEVVTSDVDLKDMAGAGCVR